MNKDLVCKKEEIKCNNIIKQCKMINSDDVTRKHKELNPNWPQIPAHPHRILIIGGSGSGKTNALLNLISHQLDIDEIYLYAKDQYEVKHQLLINKPEGVGLKHCMKILANNSK